MSETVKHTKGPILIDEHDGKFWLTADRSCSDVEGVAVVYKRADAELFAAASDLLQEGSAFLMAAEAVFDWMNGNDLSADHKKAHPEDFKQVSETLLAFRAAIAAAEGRT